MVLLFLAHVYLVGTDQLLQRELRRQYRAVCIDTHSDKKLLLAIDLFTQWRERERARDTQPHNRRSGMWQGSLVGMVSNSHQSGSTLLLGLLTPAAAQEPIPPIPPIAVAH
jgi:hypothetical protein